MGPDDFKIRGAPPSPHLPWAIALVGVHLIAHFEQGPNGGCALVAYRCEAGVWTLAWGETDGVGPGDTCTKDDGDRWLCEDIAERARRVRSLCTVEPGPHELAAMVSLSYNIGLAGFAKSSVLRLHNAGKPLAAARAFELWNKVRDKVTGKLRESAGLTRRRKAEAAMYLMDTAGSTRGMPQAVEAESKLTESPLVKIGATLAGSGGVVGVTNAPEVMAPPVPAPEVVPSIASVPADAASQVIGAAGQVGEVAEAVTSASTTVQGALQSVAGFLGVTPGLLLAGLLIAGGAAVIYWRAKQRREGWA